jgi:hypothetical protein
MGFSLIANHCDHTNGNTLNVIFPSVPGGSQIYKWNCQAQVWEPTATYNNGAWAPNLTLDPGEGAWFVNPGPAFVATISGIAHTPVPLNIPDNACCLVSRQEPLSGGVSAIVAPQDFDEVYQWTGGGFLHDTYVGGIWDGDSQGNEPIVGIGEAVWYCRGGASPPPPCNPARIVEQPSSFSVCCTNATNCATFSVSATGTAPLNYQWYANGNVITGATASSYSVCPVTAADNGTQYTVRITNDCGSVTSQVATLTVVFDTTPPTISCPADLTVQCDAYVPAPDPVVVSVTDNCRLLNVTHVSDVASGTCPKIIVRTYQATDRCGNVATCTQTITVHDTIPPALGCPNLVPNPSFEKTTSCPDSGDGVPLAAPWFKATAGSSDFFHVCASNPWAGVPTNGPGDQMPHSGEGYVGAVVVGGEYREYVESPLMGALVAGRTYEVSFYVSLADDHGYAVDNLGAYLSVGPVLNTNTAGALLLIPQVQNPAGNFLTSHTNWMLVQGTFTASGGEDHITIGNFYNESNTPVVVVPSGVYATSYYYFDDVAVREVCSLTNKIVQCGSAWAFEPPTVGFDACSGTNVALSVLSTVTNGVCPQIITRTWQVMDGCSNTATWSQSITLVDTTAPVMSCPTNIIVAAPAGQGGAVVNFTVTATDNCEGPVPVTCSAPAGFFAVGTTLVICNAMDQCSNAATCSFTVTVTQSERVGLCSFTQGFYGNAKGKFNGTPSLTVISNLLAQGPLVVGKTNSRSLTIQPGNAALLQSRLPAGGSPVTLPNNGNQFLLTALLPLNGNGRFVNVLLGQTITLSLNTRLAPPLLNVGLAPSFCTQGVLPGLDGLRGTPDDVLINGDVLMFSIPNPVLSALTNGVVGITNVTVKGLLELANRALAAQPTGGASLPDINAAVDAINRGFDECRVLVDCATGTVIADSFNDSFTNSPSLGGGGGPGRPEGDDPADPHPTIIRVRVPNVEATKEPGEPDHAGNAGGKSVWWRWLAPRSGPVLLQTAGTSFDSLLAVYTGTGLSNLVLVASNDDPPEGGAAAELNFQAQAGTEYRIAVDGYDGASGTIELSLVTERPHLCLPVARAGDEVELCIDGQPGRIYTVEASSDLANWRPLASIQYTGGTLRFNDPTNSAQRFYRVILEF